MSDLISRTELFNKLALITAPLEANWYKSDVYQIIQAMPALEYLDKGLLMFLALSYPAPEEAPDDWFHHGDENLEAWRAYIMKCKERGYYDIPMIYSQAFWQTEDGKITKAEHSVYCSKCGAWSEYRTAYCGSCGSKMEENYEQQADGV